MKGRIVLTQVFLSPIPPDIIKLSDGCPTANYRFFVVFFSKFTFLRCPQANYTFFWMSCSKFCLNIMQIGGSSGANMAVAVTKPSPTAMEYWQKKFPETPMPPAILDLLTPLPTGLYLSADSY